MENSFLPPDFTPPEAPSNYMKLETGDNKFRILASPIMGYIDWISSKPVRYKMGTQPEQSFDPSKPLKYFWGLSVYNYAKKTVNVLEITQGGIIKKITELSKNPDWGNPTEFDININKSGADLLTKYSVTPSPPKPLADDIKAIIATKPVKLEKLFTNDDPFATT